MKKVDPSRRGYVYRHIRLDTNEVFYVGVGFDDKFKRAYSKIGRNNKWYNILKETDYEVEIIMYDLSVEDTFKKEIEFISIHGRGDLGKGTLCNLTNGGLGVIGRIDLEKEYEIVNPLGEVIIFNNIPKFCEKYNLPETDIKKVLHGEVYNFLGWRFTNINFNRRPISIPQYRILSPNNELYIFYNIEEFANENNLNSNALLCTLFKGMPHCEGWHLETINANEKKQLESFLNGDKRPYVYFDFSELKPRLMAL